ncbi:uncharacterized protein PRCAT00005422001 [Priceomyces carsonii]|uniref:uncharacterized protein n=1 Tax=Priceomyces carsonii TaxID=28549 RepID=UPI002ED9B0F3|nr:unnamed protein product [Priceomyces carsonii]
MTEIKRNISEVDPLSDDHNDKRIHTKPGRKPLDTEPKSKRTAQNRAAQRAYRERKERKMKDLEDKVQLLEDERIKAVTETDFLRAQVSMLKKELSKYNSTLDILNSVPAPETSKVIEQIDGNYVPSLSSEQHRSDSNFSAEFPWSRDNLKRLRNTKSNSQTLDLVSGSSSSTSPLNENILISPNSSSNNTESGGSNPNTVKSNQYDNLEFRSNFEEQIDPFCMKLNEACGTKQYPIPKAKRDDNGFDVSPFSNIITPGSVRSTNKTSDPFFSGTGGDSFDFQLQQGDDPLSFLNDNNFDVSLAFGDNKSPPKDSHIDSLVTEESVYDPLRDSVNLDFNFNDFVKSSLPSDRATDVSSRKRSVGGIAKQDNKYGKGEEDDNEDDEEEDDNIVVPAPEETIRCSEIWDRLTSHPKYTEIDIDCLCSELRTKAKCSEKGVVLSSTDVNELLERSAKP